MYLRLDKQYKLLLWIVITKKVAQSTIDKHWILVLWVTTPWISKITVNMMPNPKAQLRD